MMKHIHSPAELQQARQGLCWPIGEDAFCLLKNWNAPFYLLPLKVNVLARLNRYHTNSQARSNPFIGIKPTIN